MPNLKKNKEAKLVRTDLNVFLALGAFDPFIIKKKKNNLGQHNEKEEIEEIERKTTDFHSDMEKKIDALLENIGKETKTEEQSYVPQKNFEDDSRGIEETRETFLKKPETPYFKTELKPENDFYSFDVKDGLFEMESKSKIQPESKIVKSSEKPDKDILNSKIVDSEHTNDKNIIDRTSAEPIVSPKHSIINFNHKIKIRSKEERRNLKEAKEKSKLHKTTPLSEKLKFKVKKKETGKDNAFIKTETNSERFEINNEDKELVEDNRNKLKKLELKKAKKEAKLKEKELEIRRLEEEKKRKLELKKARRMEKGKVKNLVDSNQKNNRIDEILGHVWKRNKENKEINNNSQKTEMDILVAGQKEMEEGDLILDEDIKKILIITDDLLGNLPEEIIDEFVKSEDFALYEKIINKYKIK